MSRIPGDSRLNRLKRALQRASRHPAAPGMAGLLLCGSAVATTPAWDCRMGPDGRSWQCLKDGQPHTDPAAPGGPEITPAIAPAVPEAMPAEIGPREPAAPGAEVNAPPVEPEATTPTPPAADGRVPRAMQQAAPPTPTEDTSIAPATARPAGRTAEPSPSSTPSAPSPAAASAFQGAGEMPDLTAPAATATEQPATQPEPMAATAQPTAPERTPTVAPTAPAAVPPAQVAPLSSATAALTADIDQGIDWQACGIASPEETQAATVSRGKRGRAGTVEVTADTAVAELDPQQATFSGNVELVQDDMRLQAANLTLNRLTGVADATGGFLLVEPDIRFAGDQATYQTKSGEAQAERATYRLPAIRARGDAERAAFFGDGRSHFDGITYTTCAPGNSTWLLTADALDLDQNEGVGTARHASLRFFGVPLLYTPYFTFPIDDRRRSGVLVPTIGFGENTGTDISVPYYFNLAENYDLTVTPRLMSKRGLLIGGEFRYLTRHSRGVLTADLLPDDREREEGNSTRGSFAFTGSTSFNPRTSGYLRLNYVSDSDYFQDLGGDLAATSATHLERTGRLTYQGDDWTLVSQVQYYQTIDKDIAAENRPYSQLPGLVFDLERPDGLFGTTYHLGAEYSYFYREDSVRGHRVALAPAVSLPLGSDWWFVEPRAGVNYTTYSLTDQTAGLDDAPSHLTGLLSLDSGMLFDREIDWFGGAAIQTLEPRLFYLYVPASEQNDQPLFDTAALDFSFDNLFRENRFSGPDRVGDANQVTLALTSRINDQASGEELLRASIGQILYLSDREVTLPDEPEVDESTSAVVAELAARLGGGWRTRAGLQWDPHDGSNGTIDQALAQVSYRGDQRQVFNAAYRLRDDVARQTDLAFYWPINRQISLIGRHNYSLRDNRLLEALAGIEYGKCCWRVRLLARKYTDGDEDEHNMAFMLQLELSGLGRLGDDIDSTLEDGIYGYRLDD